MQHRTVTWAALGVTDAERGLLRRAGFLPSELADRQPLDLVASTDDLISEQRARELTARAGLLSLMTPAKVEMLADLGVASRAELASRTAEELFVLYQDVSPYTHPAVYDRLATLIELAQGSTGERTTVEWWQQHRERAGLDLVKVAWKRRFGPEAEERPTPWTLRMPTVRAKATVAMGSPDSRGTPRPSIHPKVVVVDEATDPAVVVGHWKWAGRDGAFLRLEDLVAGDAVELDNGTERRRYAVEAVTRGPANMEFTPEPLDLTLTTPSHLRWPQLVTHWDLPRDFDQRTWLKVTVAARRVG